jgi:hypothetical protein
VPKVPEVEKDKNEDVEYSEDSFWLIYNSFR